MMNVIIIRVAKTSISCNYGLDFAVIILRVQFKQSIGFRNSEYMMDTVVPVTAFALSSLPLDFCFVHAKKKRSILVI